MSASDEELIAHYQTAGGRESAAEYADELLRRYSGRVTNWCWRFTDNRDAALDLAQEVLMKAYRNLGTFRSESKFSTWVYLIARNHCLNFVRDCAAEPVAGAAFLDLDPPDSRDWDVAAALEKESDLAQMRKLVAQVLNETEAKVMMLHYGEDLPLRTIDRLLGLTNASGAKAYVVSAKRKLKEAARRMRAGYAAVGMQH